jgi:hypothetical protein
VEIQIMNLGKWKSDPLYVKFTNIKEWIIQVGSEEKKLMYLEAIKTFLEFMRGTPKDLVEKATSAEGLTLDDKLKDFIKYLEKQGTSRDMVIDYYLAARSFYIWNGFIEKIRAVPRRFKELKATNAYDWDNPKY